MRSRSLWLTGANSAQIKASPGPGGGGSGRSIISKTSAGLPNDKVEWRACWMVRLVLVIMIVEIVVWKNRPGEC